MNVAKIQIKLFASTHNFPLHAVVSVFHEWIRIKKLPELMIDVAPYDHVPSGPGILFVGHGSDYFVEEGKGRVGLLYSRKREFPAPAERLKDSFRRAVNVAVGLEADPALAGKLKFSTDELLFRVNDRLGAPSTQATFDSMKEELSSFFSEALGSAVELAMVCQPRELFSVSVKLAAGANAPKLADVLARLGGAPTN